MIKPLSSVVALNGHAVGRTIIRSFEAFHKQVHMGKPMGPPCFVTSSWPHSTAAANTPLTYSSAQTVPVLHICPKKVSLPWLERPALDDSERQGLSALSPQCGALSHSGDKPRRSLHPSATCSRLRDVTTLASPASWPRVSGFRTKGGGRPPPALGPPGCAGRYLRQGTPGRPRQPASPPRAGRRARGTP
jgi:hypothetical protein